MGQETQMVNATRTWTGRVNEIVDPLPDSWEEAREQSKKLLHATSRSWHISGNILGRAFDALVEWFPECRDEIEEWPPKKIVEMYLDL